MYPRVSIRGGAAAFSLELPPGLFPDDRGKVPDGPGQVAAVIRSLADGPVLAVRTWSPVGAATLEDALAVVVGPAGRAGLQEARAGGPSRSHVGLAWREAGDGWVRSRFAMEFGGVVLLASAEAPEELWNDYGTFCERAMMTIELSDPSGPPTAPLRPGQATPSEGEPVPDPRIEAEEARTRALREAAGVAATMIARGDDDGAIRRVRSVDDDIRGSNVLARLFEAALVAAPDAARADALYELARDWGWRSIPSPQTAVEGEQHAEALAELEARLADIRGRAPG